MPLKTIANFKRMRQFQPHSAVVAALRDSTFLDVEGEEGEETLKRKTAYVSSSDAQRARLAASVYAKGFGDEERSTQFDIEAFFSTYGHVKHVKLRRTGEELFKGSVFVEFETVEEADAFVAQDPKPTWKDHDLLIMKKKEYLDEKNRQIKEGLLEPNSNRRNAFFEGKERSSDRGRGRGGRGRGRDDKGRDGKFDERDQRNGFRGGRGGRGRGGRGGRGFRGGRGGGRDRDSNGRDGKKEDARKNTNEYVSFPLGMPYCPVLTMILSQRSSAHHPIHCQWQAYPRRRRRRCAPGQEGRQQARGRRGAIGGDEKQGQMPGGAS